MPQPNRVQLVLVETAAAAVLGGYAVNHGFFYAGVAVAIVLLLAAVVPVRRRWLYQVAGSWLGLRRRRRAATRRPGLEGLFGEHTVELVPGGRQGGDFGVVRAGTTWSLPLTIGLESLFNDDAAVPVDLLAGLLRIEDVELSSVRLFTLTTPAHAAANAPGGPSRPLTQLAARYCLLTIDTRRAAGAIAARGGSQAAIDQILRRCATHAEQALATAGLVVRRLDPASVGALFATWMGPASAPSGRRGHQVGESWSDVRVAGTWSTVFAVTGSGPDVVERVQRLVAVAPTPVAATALVLRPDAGRVVATMLVRLSGPDSAPPGEAYAALEVVARAYDLVLQRVDGEQAGLLRATTPLGVGEPV